jgi:hypothetical protein
MDVRALWFGSDKGWCGPLPAELDSENTVVFVFGAPDVGEKDAPLRGAIRDLRQAYPRAHLVGCSTAGEIHGPAIHDRSLSVAVARFEHTKVRQATAPVASSADSFAAGDAIARSLAGDDLRAVIVLSDGLRVNGSELIRGINAVLPPVTSSSPAGSRRTARASSGRGCSRPACRRKAR